MSTSTSYHHGDLRNALLNAASELAAGGEPDALTLRAAARLAGVSHAAAYRHFTDKRELLRALALRGFDTLEKELDAAVGVVSPVTIADLAVTYLRFAAGHRVAFRLMFDRALCATGDDPDPLADAGRAAQQRLTRILDECYVITPEELPTATLAVWSQLHGLATLALETPALKDLDTQTLEQLARAAAGFLALRLR